MKYIGLKYKSRPVTEIEVLEKVKTKYGDMYRVKETDLLTGKINTNGLLLAEYIENDLREQEAIAESHKRAFEFDKKQKELREQEKQKELAKIKEYEHTFGYTDNKTPLQKGRILKTLNIKAYYKENGIDIGLMTRKDFVYMMLNKGYITEHKKNVTDWVKRSGEWIEKIIPNQYRLSKDDSYYIITKTEYDYANYLLENIINKKVV